MTLYWWMHWFWVTAHIAGCTVIGVSSPTTENLFENETVTTMETIVTKQQSFPIAKELDYSDTTNVVPLNRHVPPTVAGINTVNSNNRTTDNIFENVTQLYSESKSNENTGTFSKTHSNKKEIEMVARKNTSRIIKIKNESNRNLNVSRNLNLTVMPLNGASSREKGGLSNTNNFKIFNGLTNNSNNQISEKYTEKLLVESVSPTSTEESLRSNRARGTLFTISLQRDQTHLENNFSKLSNSNEGSPVGMYSNNGTSPTDIAIITLSCLATVVLICTAGSLGFIMYRRKYLNPPQTLNSDKCSNPDSSGYIDDSTMRDNSEEMYSLDNDSFLNSLEAMTIQNYWTDSVKHTKL